MARSLPAQGSRPARFGRDENPVREGAGTLTHYPDLSTAVVYLSCCFIFPFVGWGDSG